MVFFGYLNAILDFYYFKTRFLSYIFSSFFFGVFVLLGFFEFIFLSIDFSSLYRGIFIWLTFLSLNHFFALNFSI